MAVKHINDRFYTPDAEEIAAMRRYFAKDKVKSRDSELMNQLKRIRECRIVLGFERIALYPVYRAGWRAGISWLLNECNSEVVMGKEVTQDGKSNGRQGRSRDA